MTLLLELPPAALTRLENEAEARGMNVSAYAVTKLVTPDDAGTPNAPATGETILSLVNEIFGSLPESEKRNLPADYAENYRRYKREKAE